jgi:hypothetical protein
MKKIIVILTAFIFVSLFTQGQDKPSSSLDFTINSYYTFSWNSTFTLGDFNKWAGNASPAGFDFGGRYLIKEGLTVGYDIGWQRVSQIYSDQTYTIPDKGIAITAENYRFTWMVPFQTVIAYHIMSGKMITPYIGLGIGGDYMEHHLLIQEYDLYNTRWDFSLTPEIGVLIKFGYYSDWGALVAFNYKWTTNQIDLYNDYTSNNLQMMNLKIGIAYLIHPQ